MTGVPASAAGGPSGARRAAAGAASPAAAASGTVPGAAVGRAAARSADNGESSGAGHGTPSGAGQGGPAGAAAAGAEASGAASDEDSGSAVLDEQGDAKPPRGAKLAAAAVNQASVWNIANLLTMLRLLLVPAFVALMLADGGYDPAWRSLAWAAFAIAMITDLFDGHLARTYNLVTDFGKIADPIADKAIMGAALICLSGLGDLPWWVTGVILGRELGITLLRFLVIRYGVIPASRGGKLKTLTQGVAVGMYVLALTGWLATLRWWVMAAAVVLTVVTGLDYVKQAIVLRRQGIAERKAALEEKEA
ncbi:phosphatidylglycerophosphate synthase [Streptomyces viridochromogenes DSM 40736]|uniref:CDP-diacylglycerol--glycerol-3-phosphate 3-phosphatidyltransferase n=1 Tax=Streptomyces viridochromogenes (strain DSM 40736 / JCM 4977 / BCRC 1201 / Tue 494) TaxID=591159 RepID=D9WY58_STRVT|nr:CDP-diacylglycerol--glycerol-3-phosphate 3-phosphatidyltransferase [Streptomyces viridochromogenes]EFL35270.1 phosphatidylglycerophosphate synthase [Streptomyces viridochromogenes DSM 40736]